MMSIFIDDSEEEEDSGEEDHDDEDQNMIDANDKNEKYDMSYEDLVDKELEDKGRAQRHQMMKDDDAVW
jgi:hypothetical protein